MFIVYSVSAKGIWYHNRMKKLQYIPYMLWMSLIHLNTEKKQFTTMTGDRRMQCLGIESITKQKGVEDMYEVLNKKYSIQVIVTQNFKTYEFMCVFVRV